MEIAMDSQAWKKIQFLYVIPAFISFFTLFGIAITDADSMSGKFFSENSPIWANMYPNDYLPWAIFIFVTLGWLCGNFLLYIQKGNPRTYVIASLVSIIPLVVYFFIGFKLIGIWETDVVMNEWAIYIDKLLKLSGMSWAVGSIWAIYLHRMFLASTSHSLHSNTEN